MTFFGCHCFNYFVDASGYFPFTFDFIKLVSLTQCEKELLPGKTDEFF